MTKPYNYIGIRVDEKEFNVGDELPTSHGWDYANDCRSENYLPGTCALTLDIDHDQKELSLVVDRCIKAYGNGRVYLIAGMSSIWGNDPDEIIIKNAFVLKVLSK